MTKARGASRPHRFLTWIPSVAWMAVIFMLSSVPGSKIPGRFGALGHLIVYAVLGGLLAAAAIRHPLRRPLLIAVLVASLYGITDEYHQSFVPLRTPDIADWAVDTVGALLGGGLARLAANTLARSRGDSQ